MQIWIFLFSLWFHRFPYIISTYVDVYVLHITLLFQQSFASVGQSVVFIALLLTSYFFCIFKKNFHKLGAIHFVVQFFTQCFMKNVFTMQNGTLITKLVTQIQFNQFKILIPKLSHFIYFLTFQLGIFDSVQQLYVVHSGDLPFGLAAYCCKHFQWNCQRLMALSSFLLFHTKLGVCC